MKASFALLKLRVDNCMLTATLPGRWSNQDRVKRYDEHPQVILSYYDKITWECS